MNKIFTLLRYDWPIHFILFLTNWLPDNVVFLRARGALISPFFGKWGVDLRVGRNTLFHNPKLIDIGDHVFIAYGCSIMATDLITINDEVMFSPYVVVTSSNHTSTMGSYRYGEPFLAPIVIGKGSWIASHVVITAGSVIGENTVIGAGAIVTREIPSCVIAGGIPAKVIRKLQIEEN